MLVENDKAVQFHYRLRDADDRQIESSEGGSPATYLHGHRNIIVGLEKAMSGRQAGDKFTVTIPPEEAYGMRSPGGPESGSALRVPVKHLQGKQKWKPGMVATLQTERGPRQVTIIKAGKFMVEVDTNHPLAGKSLTFDIEVVNVRDGQPEEIARGHIHGEGGHHH